MSRFGSIVDCDHARKWAALAPDGELSDFERRSLHLHLVACGSCARFAKEVTGMTALLRSEELVSPSFITVLPRVASRRQTLVARARPVAAAAAVALMALGVASRAPLPVDGRDSGLRTTTTAVAPEQIEMRSLRVLRQGARLAVDLAELDQLPTVAANAPA
jgi:predicted anti-sigma-YlaC factor YlaD